MLKTIDVSQSDKSEILQERAKRLGITVRVNGNKCNRFLWNASSYSKKSHPVVNPNLCYYKHNNGQTFYGILNMSVNSPQWMLQSETGLLNLVLREFYLPLLCSLQGVLRQHSTVIAACVRWTFVHPAAIACLKSLQVTSQLPVAKLCSRKILETLWTVLKFPQYLQSHDSSIANFTIMIGT